MGDDDGLTPLVDYLVRRQLKDSRIKSGRLKVVGGPTGTTSASSQLGLSATGATRGTGDSTVRPAPDDLGAGLRLREAEVT